MDSVGSTATSPIPIIDFDQFLHGSIDARKEVARQVDEAFRYTGFVYLKNHGITKDVLNKCFDYSMKFFSLPQHQKLLAERPPGIEHHRGYTVVGTETHTEYDKNASLPDAKETFEMGNKADASQPNIWPSNDAIPGFRDVMEQAYVSYSSFLLAVLRCLALALGLDDVDLLARAHSNEFFHFKLLYYPSIKRRELTEAARNRISAHADFGSLTLLFQDDVGGLEIRDPDSKKFVPATPIEGTCLVNIGDQLMRWSNDRWKSTIHRVGPSTRGMESTDNDMCPARYSIAFFGNGNLDAELDALPGTWNAGNPKKYPKCTVQDFVMEKMAEVF